MDHKFLDAFKTVEYKHIQIECSPLTNDQEKEMINELQATGFVIDAKPFQSEDSEGSSYVCNILLVLMPFPYMFDNLAVQ